MERVGQALARPVAKVGFCLLRGAERRWPVSRKSSQHQHDAAQGDPSLVRVALRRFAEALDLKGSSTLPITQIVIGKIRKCLFAIAPKTGGAEHGKSGKSPRVNPVIGSRAAPNYSHDLKTIYRKQTKANMKTMTKTKNFCIAHSAAQLGKKKTKRISTRIALGVASLVLTGLAFAVAHFGDEPADAQAPVALGSASTFVVLAATAVTTLVIPPSMEIWG
jgi:hypothetical protein